jgi:hypothetical protein
VTKEVGTEPAEGAAPGSAKHATLRYTSMRVTIFLACFLVCWLLALVHIIPVAGASGAVFLLLIAAVVSAPISYVVLNKQRNAMSQQITTGVQRVRKKRDSRPGKVTMAQRIAAQNAAEDEVDEAGRAAGGAG